MHEIRPKFSHFSIVNKVGKGGMGEVFRVKGKKFGRDVAIRVLFSPIHTPLSMWRIRRREAHFL